MTPATTAHPERFVDVDGVSLCTQAFGDPAHPTLLLISGAMASMLLWEDPLCERLAAGGRHVVRYDNRDTGRSTTYPPGAPGYDLHRLAADALGVLDAYGVRRAHWVGASMGGMIAQIAAIIAPERVATLSLLLSSPGGIGDKDLPSMDPAVLDHFMSGGALDWTDREAALEFVVGAARVLAGSKRPFDEAGVRARARRDLARTLRPECLMNHGAMPAKRYRERLGEITAPTLVIHGTEDKILAFGHALALVREIPGARLLPLEGVGHELHPDDDAVITEALLAHTEER